MKRFLAIIALLLISGPAWAKDPENCVVGVQKPKFQCAAIIDFVVVDLYKQVSRKDVVRAVKAVEEQMKHDYAPKWGVSGRFELLPRGVIPTITDNRKVIVYLADTILHPDVLFSSNHWIVQDAPNVSDGPQPQFFLPQVGLVPFGTPVIIVPLGDGTYGLTEAITSPEGQFLFGLTSIGTALSFFLSHESLETLGNTFAGFSFLGAYQILTPGATQTLAYEREVCDAVNWGTFNQYSRKCTVVSNFVLPDYFNPYASPDTCLDFLGNVVKPLTPFGGVQVGYVINCTGEFDQIEYFTLPNDPLTVLSVTAPVYPPCGGPQLTNANTRKVSKFGKGHRALAAKAQKKN